MSAFGIPPGKRLAQCKLSLHKLDIELETAILYTKEEKHSSGAKKRDGYRSGEEEESRKQNTNNIM
jgi:hypothetical protein